MLTDEQIFDIFKSNKLRFQNYEAQQALLASVRDIEQSARREALREAAKICERIAMCHGRRNTRGHQK